MIVITVRPLCEAIVASCISTISGNTARNSCPRNFCIATSAGITNDTGGTLTIRKSTVSGNHVTVSCPSTASCTTGGGGVDKVDSTWNVSFAGSRIVASVGGGIAKGGTLSVNNSTIAGNAAGAGGGIYNFSSPAAATIQNSIVANNLGGNCHGTPTSNGYNLSSDGTCSFRNTGDMNNTDPQLGPLQNNGGPTNTMALPSRSPVVDAGNPSGCTDGWVIC